MILLSHVNEWIIELERVVGAYESTVDEVEELIDQLEQDAGDEQDRLIRTRQEHQRRRQLENALETAQHLAQLVHAANAILNDAIETATIGLQLITPIVGAGEDADAGRGPSWSPAPGADADAGRGPLWSPAPRNDADAGPGPLWSPAPDKLSTSEPLPNGSIILQDRYRIVQLLHARPRLHLYLAQRLPPVGAPFIAPADTLKDKYTEHHEALQPIVAIRELVLADLSPQVRKQIERAAFEEFVAPMLLGSPRLPGTGDRIRIENNRHYLVMQLRPARGQRQAVAVTLAELLLIRQPWPSWLDMQTALEWGMRLCRIVTRLHRPGIVLGDLNPATVLVDAEGAAEWAPVLLVSWPPAPQFWPSQNGASAQELRAQIFPTGTGMGKSAEYPAPGYPQGVPLAGTLGQGMVGVPLAGTLGWSFANAFIAPEMLAGKCDERSDVYSLGAILYLLLTRYAPPSAALRERAGQRHTSTSLKSRHDPQRTSSGPSHTADAEGMQLIPPHLFNHRIPATLEHILLRALALNPAERYPAVFDLVEALEAVELQNEMITTPTVRKAPRIAKVIERLKHELHPQ